MNSFWITTPEKGLVDVVETLKEFPNFSNVDDAAREAAHFGDSVKIGCDGEYFWVDVMAKRDGKLYGRVNNDLEMTSSHGLRYDDTVVFEPRHIREIAAYLPQDTNKEKRA